MSLYLVTDNREAYLTALAEKLRGHFTLSGFPLPEKIAYAVGFPSKGGRSKTRRRIGECWSSHCTPDATVHILISPVLKTAEEAGATLVHELVHAAIGAERGHDRLFKNAMKAIGLEGRPISSGPGQELQLRLKDIIVTLGPYPHQPLEFNDPDRPKSEKGRMLKAYCPQHPDFPIRASKKVLEEAMPLCAMCKSPMKEAA